MMLPPSARAPARPSVETKTPEPQACATRRAWRYNGADARGQIQRLTDTAHAAGLLSESRNRHLRSM